MVTYEEYQSLMNRQIQKKNDKREKPIQDNVIRPFLQILFPQYDIEAVDTKTPSNEHEFYQYCGKYIDKKGREKTTPPDLCIAKGWNWDNINNNVEYKCVIEIKSPFLEPITGFTPEKYDTLQISRHLNSKNNSKVILTDGVTWVFYSKERGLVPCAGPISLGELEYEYELVGNRKRLVRTPGNLPIVKSIIWKKSVSETVDNEVINEIFGHPLSYKKELPEYTLLIETIQNFVN